MSEGKDYFTLVFEGDITKFDGNVFHVETPFGKPVAAAIGDALQRAEDEANEPDAAATLRALTSERDALQAENERLRADLRDEQKNTNSLIDSARATGAREATDALRARVADVLRPFVLPLDAKKAGDVTIEGAFDAAAALFREIAPDSALAREGE